MSKYSLEDRVRMRAEIELGTGSAGDLDYLRRLEEQDSANPIAQTEQVRPPLRLNIDIAAFQAVYDDLDHE